MRLGVIMMIFFRYFWLDALRAAALSAPVVDASGYGFDKGEIHQRKRWVNRGCRHYRSRGACTMWGREGIHRACTRTTLQAWCPIVTSQSRRH